MNFNLFKKIIFWDKFSRFLLIGLSTIVLVAISQNFQLNDVFAQSVGECVGGNTYMGNGIYIPGCSGSQNIGQPGQPPAPAPAPVPSPASSCTPIDQIRTEQDCVGDQWCTFNIWKGTDCSEGRGGAYGCQQIPGRCGFNPAPPPPAPVPPPPVSNVCFVGKACSCSGASAGSCSQCNGGWCNGGQCSSCSAPAPAPAPPLPPASPPQCPTGTISTSQRCVGVQMCNFDTIKRSDCSTFEGSAYSCQNSSQCGFSPPVQCTPSTSSEIRCVGQQQCTYNVTLNANNSCGNRVENGPFSCQFVQGQCGYNPGPTCTVRTTQDTQCVNQQLCTFEITRHLDCSTSRSGPVNCQNSTQCGFIPPVQPASTVVASNPPINVTNNNNNSNTNTNTITVSSPREVIREVQTFRNVGIGTSVANVQYVNQLPKTGLPVIAWSALAFIPAGFKLRSFSKLKGKFEGKPHYLWEMRQYHKS